MARGQRGWNLWEAILGAMFIATEQDGQTDFINSETLPKDCEHWDVLESMGVQRLEEADKLFYRVRLPAGWRRELTEHHLHSHLIDNKGRKRAEIFYKDAPHDRRAEMYVETRYSIADIDGIGEDANRLCYAVLDGTTELFRTELVSTYNGTERERAERIAIKWLNKEFPNWKDPGAYWD